jgi:hypothetical protein
MSHLGDQANEQTKPCRADQRGLVEEILITAIRKTVTAAGCAAVLLATAAACGTVQNLTAGQKVDHAVDRLGEQKSLAVQLDLDAAPDALTALADDNDSGDALPPELAKFISGLRVDVAVKSRKPLSDSDEKDLIGTSVRVSGADGVLAEYRVVGDFMYYRADMKALGEAMAAPMPAPDQIPDSAKEFRKILEGKWVKVDTEELARAQKSHGSAKSSVPALGGIGKIDTKVQQKVMKAVRGVIAHDITFRAQSGSHGAEHIVAKGNFRDLIRGVVEKLRPLEGDLPPGTDLPSDKDLKDAPDKNVAVDFTLKNGDLIQVEADLSLLADSSKKELPLVLKFSRAGDVSAPSGATEIPVDKVPGSSPLGASGLLGAGEL